MRARAALQQIGDALRRAVVERRLDPYEAIVDADADADGRVTHGELQVPCCVSKNNKRGSLIRFAFDVLVD